VRSISGNLQPISSPTITIRRRSPIQEPNHLRQFVDGIIDCFEKAKIAPADARFFNHGTTLVINALIQRHGAKVALVHDRRVSRRLEIARANVPTPSTCIINATSRSFA